MRAELACYEHGFQNESEADVPDEKLNKEQKVAAVPKVEADRNQRKREREKKRTG